MMQTVNKFPVTTCDCKYICTPILTHTYVRTEWTWDVCKRLERDPFGSRIGLAVFLEFRSCCALAKTPHITCVAALQFFQKRFFFSPLRKTYPDCLGRHVTLSNSTAIPHISVTKACRAVRLLTGKTPMRIRLPTTLLFLSTKI